MTGLVERAELLERLRAERAAARAGPGRVVFLEGESGVGKTSVARALANDAGGGLPVLWGACDALATPRPLGPLRDMAAGGARRTAARLAEGAPTHELFAALLADMARPSLVVIEDVHWADEATLDLLRFVGRRIAGTRALLVATLRDDEVGPGHPLRTVMGDLATAGTLRLRVPPLSLAGVRQIASDQPIDADHLHRVTGGNPFFVTEVLAAPSWTVPPSVRDAVLARVGRLSGETRRVLEAVSVEPGSLERRVVAALGSADAAVAAATDAGVLVDAGGRLRFRHELGRLAVAEGVPAARRSELHAAILAILEAAAVDDPARLAHHAEGAGDPDSILRWASAAGRAAAASGAHREAARHLARAVEHGRRLPPAELAGLHEAYAEELIIVDQPGLAVAAWQRAVELRRATGDLLAAGIASAQLARAMWTSGQAEPAYALIAATTDELEQHGLAARAALPFAMRGYLAMLDRRAADAVTWSRRAIEVAEAAGDDADAVASLGHALNALGSARIVGFDDPEGLADLHRSAEIGERLSSNRLVENAWSNAGSALGEVRRYAQAAEYLERSIRYAGEHDMDFSRHYAVAWLARVRFETGSWDEAERLADEALGGEEISPISPIVALGVRGRLRTRRGEHGAREALDQAWRLATRTGDLQRLWPAVAGRAEHAWLADEIGPALRSEVAEVLAMARIARLPWAIGELAFWASRLGVHDVETDGAAPAYAAHVAGDHAGAAAAWAAVGCPYEEAWALADSGDPDAMRTAVRRLAALGAQPLADRVRRAMRERGLRQVPSGPRRATAESPSGLTPREHEVLVLLAAGLTDREIAERLVVSPKTAGHHVSAILGKLGVRRRTEAARRAIGMGWLPTEDGETSR